MNSSRWKKGVSGNPAGRSPRKTEAAYLKAMIGKVALKDWREITAVAVRDAKKGDKDARKWLSGYLMGKPEQPMTLDTDQTITIIRVSVSEND